MLITRWPINALEKIRVDAELDSEISGMVAIHFTDNGSGMSEDTMKKVFNYGYTTKPPGKGSGLGYICVNILSNCMAGLSK